MKITRFAVQISIGAAVCLLGAPRAHAVENVSPPNAMTDEKTAKPAVVAALESASEGLLMPSETDAPFVVVFFPLEKEAEKVLKTEAKTALSPEKLAKIAGAPKDAKVEIRDLTDFFKIATTIEDWMNEDEKATATRFAALLETLQKQLKNPQVLVWGEAEKQVAIVGEAEENALAGVTTLVVET